MVNREHRRQYKDHRDQYRVKEVLSLEYEWSGAEDRLKLSKGYKRSSKSYRSDGATDHQFSKE